MKVGWRIVTLHYQLERIAHMLCTYTIGKFKRVFKGRQFYKEKDWKKAIVTLYETPETMSYVKKNDAPVEQQ